jgi:cob(I)alamin adenosyltransferase
MGKGLIHIYTGDGKGKTTAAVGLALRAKARGLRVLFAQFMKTERGNELDMLENLSVNVIRFDEILSPLFYPGLDGEAQRRKTVEALSRIKSLMKDFDLVILDEFIHLINRGLVSEAETLEFLKSKPGHTELVLTGKGAPPYLIDAAHYVTEMKAVKHPFREGVKARRGIEY